jgi:hypothetical protein
MAKRRRRIFSGSGGAAGLALALVVGMAPACDAPPGWRDAGEPAERSGPAPEGWRVQELAGVPRHFRLGGWLDEGTLLGLAGSEVVELPVTAPGQPRRWGVRAWSVTPGHAGWAAWRTEEGIRVGRAGSPSWLVVPAVAPPPGTDGAEAGAEAGPGDADLGGRVWWSPGGDRLVAVWVGEWQSWFGLVEVATGAIRPLDVRLDGYFLTRGHGWLDDHRLLFSADAVRDREGRSEYREGGGYRTDLAVLELPGGAYRRVTGVPDGVHLHPLGPWSDDEWLVGEARPGAPGFARFWAYHTRRWSRRPLDLPPADRVLATAPARVLLGLPPGAAGAAVAADVAGPAAGSAPGALELVLASGRGLVRPGVVVDGDAMAAWDPGGSRVVVVARAGEDAASSVMRVLLLEPEPAGSGGAAEAAAPAGDAGA